MGALARILGRAETPEVGEEDERDLRIRSVVEAVVVRMQDIARLDPAQMSVGVSPDGSSLTVSYAVDRILRSDSFRCAEAVQALRYLLASVAGDSGFDFAEGVYFQEVMLTFGGKTMRLSTIPGEPTRFVLVDHPSTRC